MIQDFLGSIASTQAYRRFTTERAGRTFLYLLFISLLNTVGGSVILQFRFAPVIDETFAWLATEVPTLTIAAGKISSSEFAPKRLSHPKAPEIALMIDTSRTEPVTLQTMKDAKVMAYLTNNMFYIESKPGKMEAYDLSKAAIERPIVIDTKFFREAAGVFKKIVYPLLILALFAGTAAWKALAGLFYSLLAMIFNSMAGSSLGFGSLYQIAIHAQTTALLMGIIMPLLPFAIPFSGLALIMITAVYLWLAVKANTASESPAV